MIGQVWHSLFTGRSAVVAMGTYLAVIFIPSTTDVLAAGDQEGPG